VALLNQQILAMREQLAQLALALEASENKSKEQQVQIADLGSKLNSALASKVEELARYRSEFFGRLREALGDRQDIRIVGDRFVFQSEVLFASGSAEIGDAGRDQLDTLATTLILITKEIPEDINWVLRVDGHTDKRPITSGLYPSNWELSTARAIAVVKYLASKGIPRTSWPPRVSRSSARSIRVTMTPPSPRTAASSSNSTSAR
jgi:chemotaxis protein MotB